MATKMIKELEGNTCEKHLEVLGILRLGKGRLWSDLIVSSSMRRAIVQEMGWTCVVLFQKTRS